MSEVLDHPDIEKLPLEIDGVAVREVVRGVFRDPDNGTPDNISKAGCLPLADRGYLVWNAWRERFPVSGATNRTNFSGCIFHGRLISFEKMKFGENATFEGALFGFGQSFQYAEFGDRTNFIGAQFANNISFKNARFEDDVDFYGLHWEDLTAIYSDGLDVAKAWAIKLGTSPNSFMRIDFVNCHFGGKAYFSDREFKRETFFEKSTFAKPPIFHNCIFHQNTRFDNANFPEPTGHPDNAKAYRTLKLAFSGMQAVREEQEFFKREMAEETLRETGIKRWFFMAYKRLSDYGFSITRPLAYGGLTVLALSLTYGLLSWLGQCGLFINACAFAPQWLEFSLLQTLPLPGFDKLSAAASKVFWPEGAWWNLALSTLVIVQKTVSLAALFLVGLALRNLFKLK